MNNDRINCILLKAYYGNHNHSEYSNMRLLDCNIKLGKLIDEAVNMGLSGISITDHECLSGHIEAIQKAKELREKGIDFTVGLGDEIYLVESIEEVRDNYISGVTKFPHFIVVAKDEIGYRGIRDISTQAWMNYFKQFNYERVPISYKQLSNIMKDYKGHIIASTACLGGYLGILCNRYYNTYDEAEHEDIIRKVYKYIDFCKSTFGEDDFYLELQPSFNEEQIRYNKFLINLSKTTNTKLIFTTDTHFLNISKKPIHKALLNSRDGDREVDDFYGSTYLMTTKEVWDYFKDYIDIDLFEQMINNTNEIRNKITFYDLHRDTIVPQIDVPSFPIVNEFGNRKNEFEYIAKFYDSEYEIDRYLLYQLSEGMKKKNKPFDFQYLDRINTELKQLWGISEKLKSRLSSYYLLVQELIDIMWTVSLVGCARGSGTGFLINYLLDITQVNPLDFDLPWWRHIKVNFKLCSVINIEIYFSLNLVNL